MYCSFTQPYGSHGYHYPLHAGPSPPGGRPGLAGPSGCPVASGVADSVLARAGLLPVLVDDTLPTTTTTGYNNADEPNDALPGEPAKTGRQMEQQRKRNQVQ